MTACFQIECSQSGPLLRYGECAKFSEDSNLIPMCTCRYFEPDSCNMTSSKHILLPRNLSQLNDYMCGPLNRKGLVCSECADGFCPSVISFRHRCVNCTDAWYGVPLFLFLELAPITVLYFVILVFQINVLSAPMPCFIMHAQLVVIVFDSDSYFSLSHSWNITLDMKIMLILWYSQFRLWPPYKYFTNLQFEQ